jgi:hypothetical protein
LSVSRPSRSCTPSSRLCLSLSRWVGGMSLRVGERSQCLARGQETRAPHPLLS